MDNTYRKNLLQNASFAFVLQAVNIIVTFGVRTVFLRELGNDYMSLNGLFTNVVSLLSFAELGLGNAVIFSLYEPVAKHDVRKIQSLLRLYRAAYLCIRVVILVIGFVCLLFVEYLVKGISVEVDVRLIFALFLINTYVSYFWVHKKSLLIADQKNYIAASIQQGIVTVQAIIQCAILLVWHNFLIFLVVQIVCTLLTNVFTGIYVDKHYPYVKEHSPFPPSETVKIIANNVKNIFCYKLGAVILNGTDNILISMLIKTTVVGIYSNYAMVVNALNSVLIQACSSITATIGNYNVENSTKDTERTFRMIFLTTYWIFSVCTVCLMMLLNPFIELWLGTEYLLSGSTVVIISLVFYCTGINQIPSQYRSSFGLFWQARWVPLTAAGLNVVLSVILGRMIGINGIFVATILAKLFTFNIVDPILIYKKGFELSFWNFFFLKVKLFILLMGNAVIAGTVIRHIPDGGIILFGIKASVVFICSNIICLMALKRELRIIELIGKRI